MLIGRAYQFAGGGTVVYLCCLTHFVGNGSNSILRWYDGLDFLYRSTEVAVADDTLVVEGDDAVVGTNLVYLLGFMLTCIAGAGLMMRKRKAA